MAIACIGVLLGLRTSAQAERVRPVPTVELWIAATPHVDGATTSEIRLIRHAEELEQAQPWATLHHAPNAPIRGDVIDRSSLVVAFEPEGADPRDDFSTEVHRVDSLGSQRLTGHVYRATRPLVTHAGVFVERGEPGAEPGPTDAARGMLRVDRLTIDQLDVKTGALRTVARWAGYTMHLVGEWQGALVVYRVGPSAADVSLIRTSDGVITRSLAVAPFARDFVLSGDQVAFSNHDVQATDRWVLSTLDLATFTLSTLGAATGESPIPYLTPDLKIGMSARSSTRPSATNIPLLTPARSEVPLGLSHDRAFMLVATPGEFDVMENVHVTSSRRFKLTEKDERVEFIGYREGTRGALR